MPRERLSMRTIREVLRLSAQGQSQRSIALACHVSATTVREYLTRAQSAGLRWPLPEGLTEESIVALLYPVVPPSFVSRPVPDWGQVTVALRRKHVTLFLLWEEYRALYPDGFAYSTYCERYLKYSATLDPRMHQVHKAGEKLFVDYAGPTMAVTDRSTGEVKEVQIFVATLGASDLTYSEGTWTQTIPDWIGSHVRALEFLGGVPEMIVPDNLKSGVTSACRYEPDINVTYLKFAEHYGVAILPARAQKPRDKAKVENHVLNVERRVMAPLRNQVFFSLDELNQAVWQKVDELNERPFQKLEGNRKQLFAALDAPLLRPLPTTAYVPGTWSKARVHIDYHIEVEKNLYSVPYTLLHKEMEVHLTAVVVEILYKGNRIASHPRSYKVGYYSTNPLHMPHGHRAYAEWTPERLVKWASESGASTCSMIEAILLRRLHPQQGFRSCLGIMSLAKRYGKDRLDAACRRGLALGAISYKSVKSILETGLDQDRMVEAAQERPLPVHSNIRGSRYYGASNNQSSAQSSLDIVRGPVQTTLSLEEER